MITERIDAITRIPADRLAARLPAPRSVKIELTDQCNYACQFCSLKNRATLQKRAMDFGLFQRITTEMRGAGVEEVGLFYIGESFMAPRLLVQGIAHLKAIGMPYVFLTTNGSLAHPGTVEKCMAAGLDSLKWSINAADAAQFEDVMGKPARLLAQSLANLRAARKIRDEGGYQCGLYASSILLDGAQADAMAQMLAREVLPFVDQHYFLPLYGRMTKQSEARAAELGFVPTAGNQGRVGALVDPLPCWAVFTEGHVRVDGHLSACCFGADDQYDMGDLTAQGFMDAWNSPAFVSLRQAHLNKDIGGTVCDGCYA